MLDPATFDLDETALRARVGRGEATWADHHALGVLRYRAGHFDDALEHATRARALGASGGATAYLLGLVHREAGRLDEAARDFEAAAAESGRDALRARALYGLGTVRCLAGAARAALDPLRRAVELRPDLAEAWHNLGVAAVRACEWDEAGRAFKHLASAFPARREGYLSLLVDVGRAAGLDEMRSQGHRIKNLVSVLGDEARRFAGELAREGSPAAARADGVVRGVEGVFVAMQRYLAAMREVPLDLDLVDVNDLVGRCLFAASSALEGLSVERRLATTLPEVVGDRAALEDVVLNVLLNAVEALREERRDVPAPDLLVVTRPDRGGVVIDVEDRGPGIDPARREAVFLLGYTTKPRGSGIGLAQVRKVVRAHGGDVLASAASHGGARLSIVLPVRPPGETRLSLLALRSPLFESLADLVLSEPTADGLSLAP